jgi:hypothetical protein
MAYTYTTTYEGYGQAGAVITATAGVMLTAYQIYLDNIRRKQEEHRIEREAAAAAAAQAAQAAQAQAQAEMQMSMMATPGAAPVGIMSTLGMEGMPSWVLPVGLGVGGLLLYTLVIKK